MRARQLLTMMVLYLGSAAGQTSTLSIPFMGFNFDAVDASVVTVEDGRTTLALNCPPGSGSTNCGVYATETVVTGPSTYSLVLTDPTVLSFTQACVPSGASPFSTYSCQESAEGTKVQDGPSSSTTVHTDDVTYAAITVTAGVNLLAGGAAPAATTTTGAATTTAGAATTSSGASACSTSGQITECSGVTMSAGSGTSTDSSMPAASTAAAGASTGSSTSNAAAATGSFGLNKAVGLLAFPLILL
ncbi:hypothetical protein M409DRAFT_19112 [Zasmidium cellare ATCC 36951]|uniref:GPI anchored protein n=1 Tax=Zasmidium cellare ATCC 36951 TaxID=1080233 RepID=A0A6A6CVJ9_ZASCE|nr:uncharacterized protein M409DRAFT_19112 [Zasmidium cellare ATCC 36951]KAF2171141.1 hypothetical protein M409DRAFT_19112 [Zasmidium cellare ATCC 36951]